jgi:hypothetical protein
MSYTPFLLARLRYDLDFLEQYLGMIWGARYVGGTFQLLQALERHN